MNETVSEVTSAKDPVRLSVECDNPSALGEVTWRSANTDVARVIADPANDQSGTLLPVQNGYFGESYDI